jgi:hypothetical protein
MLDVCECRLAQKPADVQARAQIDQADIHNFDTGRTFKLITMPFRPFQHPIEVDVQIARLLCS